MFGLSGLVMNSFVTAYHAMMINVNKSPKYVVLMSLALADSVTGIYLLGLGIADSTMKGTYAIDESSWRASYVCYGLAMAQTVSMEVSLSCLVLFSVMNTIAITHNKNPQKRKVAGTTLTTYLFFITISSIPLTITSSLDMDMCVYHTLSSHNIGMLVYNIVLHLVLNGGMVILSTALYIKMVISINSGRRNLKKFGTVTGPRNKGMYVWLTLQVLVRVLCWSPVQVVLLTALCGATISSEFSSWLMIFLMAINSHINPVLYTLRTL